MWRRNDQYVVDRIDGDRLRLPKSCIGPLQNANRRDVSIAFSRIDPDFIIRGHEDLVVDWIDIEAACSDSGVWPLNDSNGAFLSISASLECQDRVGVGNRNNKLVV